MVHALPFTTHTELLEAEDLVRGLTFASHLARSAGLDLPRDAKMTDVPSHSWIMPTLLRHAGVDLLHLGCNAASRSPQVPPLFWWEGPDGSRLLTMYTAEGYGTGLVPPQNWPHKTWLALIHTGDNHGPPTPDEVKKLLERGPGQSCRACMSASAACRILPTGSWPRSRTCPSSAATCPTPGSTGRCAIRPERRSLATSARRSLLRKRCTPNSACGACQGIRAQPPRPIAAAYEQSLLYGEHTWGGALYWVTKYNADRKFNYGEAWKGERTQGRFQRLEESWKEHTAYIESRADLTQPLLDRDLQLLAQATGTEGQRVVVYNPLPWKRDGWVALPAGPTAITVLRPVDGDGAVPLETENGVWRFVARAVPRAGLPHLRTGEGRSGADPTPRR